MMSAVRVIAVAAMLWSASVTAQTTEATTTALPTYDANYPPTATEEVEARNTTQYAHGSRYQFTIHIEASEPTTIGLPKTLYRRAVFYPAVDQLSRLLVKGSVESIGSQYNNVTVFFEVGDSIFGGFPGAPDRRVWKQDTYWNRYWEFLIFADCLTQAAAETGDLKCGTIIAAGVSDDGCGVGCTDVSCLDPAPIPATTTTVAGQTTTETTATTTSTTILTNAQGGRPGRRCFTEQSRDLAVFVGWAGTSSNKVAFTSRKDMPSYQLYAFGDLGSAVTDEFSLFG